MTPANSRKKAMSGIVAAIAIMMVLVMGFATVTYINATSAQRNRELASELMMQASKAQELVRIYIHSTDGSIEAPARITFVNAWGFESRIRNILIFDRALQPLHNVSVQPPLILRPGAKVSLTPTDIGLSYPDFKTLADNVGLIVVYTDLGNRFGNTWGMPKEDNLAGVTTSYQVNSTVINYWVVPSFTTVNNSFTMFTYTTLNPPAPPQETYITARSHFQMIYLWTNPRLYNYYSERVTASVTIDDNIVEGKPATPQPGWFSVDFGYVWAPCGAVICYRLDSPLMAPRGNPISYTGYHVMYRDQWHTITSPTETAIRNTYYVTYNAPKRYVINISGENGYCVVSYILSEVRITPTPSDYPAGSGPLTRRGMALELYASIAGYTRNGPTLTVYHSIHAMTLLTNSINAGRALSAPIPTTLTTYGGREFRAVASPTVTTFSVDGSPVNDNRVRAFYFPLTEPSYTIDRYYTVENIQCSIYVPTPQVSGGTIPTTPTTTPLPPPPPRCNIVAALDTSPSQPSGGGFGSMPVYQNAVMVVINCPPR